MLGTLANPACHPQPVWGMVRGRMWFGTPVQEGPGGTGTNSSDLPSCSQSQKQLSPALSRAPALESTLCLPFCEILSGRVLQGL